MAKLNEGQTIIIRRIKKSGGGHHGGAWKVAYADFVTAMMAFFLLLWLLNAVTEEQLDGIANYFAPVTVSSASSGSGGLLGGATIVAEGSMENVKAQPSVVVDLPPPSAGSGGDSEGGSETFAESKEDPEDPTKEIIPDKEITPEEAKKISEEQAKEVLEKLEEQQFEDAIKKMQQAIESVPSLKNLAKSLLLENTPEGLRIQIVDQEGLAMFASGSSEMYQHTRRVMELVAKVVMNMPQSLSISGHTDSTKFVTSRGYSNWELSADRANSSRRALLHFGIPESRVSRVIGKSATDPLILDNPKHPSNRRISIILLRGTGNQHLPQPATGANEP